MASGLIQPRKLPPKAWKIWIREGFELFSRKCLLWIVLMSGASLVAGMAGQAAPIAEFLALALGFNLATAVDEEYDGVAVARHFARHFRGAVRFAVQFGSFVLVVSFPLHNAFALSEEAVKQLSAAWAVDVGAIMGGLNASMPLASLYERAADPLVTWAMLLPAGLGFLYPLRRLGIDFYQGVVQGQTAAVLNQKAVALVAILSLASTAVLVGFGLHPLIPVVQGFWMAVNYVMFRDIFLWRARNLPVPVQVAMALQPIPVRAR